MSEQTSESGLPYDSTPTNDPGPDAGVFPYRSGIHQGMYRDKPWTMRQYAGFGNPEEANSRLKQLIENGVTGLSIAFDLPTQMGLDPDNELAKAEVGKVGVSISHLQDMRTLFDDIDISKISTSMTINATAPILLLMYQIIGEERNVPIHLIKGTIQNDILKEYISRGTYIFSPSRSLELTTETIIYCKEFLPSWNSISISGYHMSEAGASAVQEISFTFTNAITYLNTLIDKGVHIDDIAPRISFFFSARMSLLEEVAKFRAAREVWAQTMKMKFGAKESKSWQLRFHTQTAGVQLIAQNSELNIVRVTIQALSAIFGGTQSLHTNAYDEAISLPSDDSARIALQTQQILMEETDLTKAIDPFRGSFVIENMTNEMIKEIEKEMFKIEKMGGALQAIQEGYQVEKIEENAFSLARRVEDGEQKIVGLNFGNLEESSFFSAPFRDSQGNKIMETFLKHKVKRNNTEVNIALDNLKEIASLGIGYLPGMKTCLIVGATIGEICGALAAGWGDTSS